MVCEWINLSVMWKAYSLDRCLGWPGVVLGLSLIAISAGELAAAAIPGHELPHKNTDRLFQREQLGKSLTGDAQGAEISVTSFELTPLPVMAQNGTPGLRVDTIWGSGTVTIVSGGQERVASSGDVLALGDELISSEGANVRLVLDNNRGSVEVAEFSHFRIDEISGDQVELDVRKGRVRLSLGQISSNPRADNSAPAVANAPILLSAAEPLFLQSQGNSGSNYNFRVRTPTGVAGVRGTSFGVNVGPNGQTGISSLDGTVAAIAQEQQVLVESGQYSGISPNADDPRATAANPVLTYLKAVVEGSKGSKTLSLTGAVHPLDLVYVNGLAIETDPDGNFALQIPRPASRRLRFVVRGPAVRERVYVIPVN